MWLRPIVRSRSRPQHVVAGLILVVALVSLAAAGAEPQEPPQTGSVAGLVHIVARPSKRLVSAGAYPGRAIGTAVPHQSSESSNVIVFVKATATPSVPTRAAIRQVDEAFLPRLVAITAGSTVDFPNDDFIFHNVFSLSRAASFDLGRFPQGHSRSRRFDRPGIIKVFCHLHSHMSALIRVFDHPFFAIPDPQGRFTIPGLAPGAYDVVAWHERVGEVTRATTVVAGRAVDLTFSLPLTDTP